MYSVPNLMKSGLRQLGRTVCAQPVAVLIAGAVLTVASVFLASNITVYNSIDALLPEGLSASAKYEEYKEVFNTEPEYVFLIESDNPERNKEVALKLADELRKIGPGIARVDARRDFANVMAKPLLLADIEQIEQISTDIDEYIKAVQNSKGDTGFNVNGMLRQIRGAMSDDDHLRKKENWKKFEPQVRRMVSMLNKLAAQLEGDSTPKKGSVDVPEETVSQEDLSLEEIQKRFAEVEFNQFLDGKAIIITALPGVKDKSARSPYTTTIKKIRNVVAKVRSMHPDVEIGLTGEPVVNEDEAAATENDIPRAAVITLILISCLFFFSYRELGRPLLALLALGMAVAWSFGWTLLSVGHLNIITMGFIPMMLGLGIDFGIQLIGRYEEELASGKSSAEAIEESLVQAGFPVITSGLTTATAFYTLTLSDFTGLAELGLISSGAIICCLLSNVIMLPAMMTLRDRKRDKWHLLGAARRSAWTFHPSISRGLVRFPYAVSVIGIAITLFFAFQIKRMVQEGSAFDYNLLNLQNQELESVKIERRLLEITGSNSITGVIIARSEVPGESDADPAQPAEEPKSDGEGAAVEPTQPDGGKADAPELAERPAEEANPAEPIAEVAEAIPVPAVPVADGEGEASPGSDDVAVAMAPAVVTPLTEEELAEQARLMPLIERNKEVARKLVAKLEARPSVAEVFSILPALEQLEGQDIKVEKLREAIEKLNSVEVNTDVSSQINVAAAKRDINWLYTAAIDGKKEAAKFQGLSSLAKKATQVFDSMIAPLGRMKNSLRRLNQEEVGERLNRYQIEVFGKMMKELAWLRDQKVDEPIQLYDFPDDLRYRFIGDDGELLLQVSAKGNIFEEGPLAEFVSDLREVDPHATGTPVTNYEFIRLIFTSFSEASSLAFIAIFIVVVLYFHNWIGAVALVPLYLASLTITGADTYSVILMTVTLAAVAYFIRDALFALLPLALAVIWTLGTMAWCDISFNPANVMTLPMVIGIGVAYGIYTVDRFRETGKMEIFTTSTGKAILLSAFTTMFAFGSMMGSQYIGLYSMGQIMTLGVTLALVTSIFLLPQLLEISARFAPAGADGKPKDEADKSTEKTLDPKDSDTDQVEDGLASADAEKPADNDSADESKA